LADDGGDVTWFWQSFQARASLLTSAQPAVIEFAGRASSKWAQEASDETCAKIKNLIKAELDELK
jgi:hypothetical protein